MQVYNDLSCSDYEPGKVDAAEKVRHTLGKNHATSAFSYPRRLRTGRPPMKGQLPVHPPFACPFGALAQSTAGLPSRIGIMP